MTSGLTPGVSTLLISPDPRLRRNVFRWAASTQGRHKDGASRCNWHVPKGAIGGSLPTLAGRVNCRSNRGTAVHSRGKPLKQSSGLGLAIGLQTAPPIANAAEASPGLVDVVAPHLERLLAKADIGSRIISFWSSPHSHRTPIWADHREINEVMLAIAPSQRLFRNQSLVSTQCVRRTFFLVLPPDQSFGAYQASTAGWFAIPRATAFNRA